MSLFRIKKFIQDIWLHLSFSKLKELGFLIKFWWENYFVSSCPTLELLQYWLQQNLKYWERINNNGGRTYSASKIKKIKITLECLRKIIDEDYGEIDPFKRYIIKQDENTEMFLKYLKNIERW